ncbi:plasmid pRiA4b ORF-3 family protein [Phyllobacterium sp. P30BS-XVII]|uniref:plasmid pRiA4b ORF-3 family protein n=1 Tax=Phyllobacterium sp. P30BS-XVII TaxID=2587046 RepID=UPI001840012B|nr:hypothetical protein [Phyllobacterium sp. P30BS-XVII]
MSDITESESGASIAEEEILQFRIWLKDVSPMIWRRVQVPVNMTLRELHGVFLVAMGWENIHLFQFGLRASRFGSWELSAKSPDVTLDELQLRKGIRFRYEYDLNIPWEHEVRLEARLSPDPRRNYPYCTAGSGNCPPEDCGGPFAFMSQTDSAFDYEAYEDLAEAAEMVNELVFQGNFEIVKDKQQVEEIKALVDRLNGRVSMLGIPFERKSVNGRFRQGDHLMLMHQQL